MSRRRIIAPQAAQENRNVILGEPQAPRDLDSPEHRRALQRLEDRQKFVTIADQIARETLFLRNYRWPGSTVRFPDDIDANMRFVTKYYPHAEGGPLFVDEPSTFREVIDSYKKQKILKELGFRCIIVEHQHYTPEGNIVQASTLTDVLEQLEDKSA